jgi:hypothetical protein
MDVDAFLSGCIFGVGRSTVYCAIERQRNEARTPLHRPSRRTEHEPRWCPTGHTHAGSSELSVGEVLVGVGVAEG